MNNVENRDNVNKKIINMSDFDKSNDINWNIDDYNKTIIAAVFLGVFGVHRFINKKYITGIIMLLTVGGFTIWALVDIYLIISRKFKNSKGETLIYSGEFYEYPLNLVALCICSAICFGFIRYANIDKDVTNETTNETINETTNEAINEATQEILVAIQEQSKSTEQSTEQSTEESLVAEESKVIARADITGKFKDNAYNSDSGIILESASIEEGKEADRYNVECTLRNNTSDFTFKNVIVKITISNKEGKTYEHVATVFTEDVLKPGESKDFTFDRNAKGDVTDVEIELVSYEEVK